MITLDFRPRRARRGAPAGAWVAAVLGLVLLALGLAAAHVALDRAVARRDARIEEVAGRVARQRTMRAEAERLTGRSRELAAAVQALDTLADAPAAYRRVIALLAGTLPARSPVAIYLDADSLVVSSPAATDIERVRPVLAQAGLFDSLAVRAPARTGGFRLVGRPGARDAR